MCIRDSYIVMFSSAEANGGDRYYRGPGLESEHAAEHAGLFDVNVGPESGNTWTGTVQGSDPVLRIRYFASWGFLDGVGGLPILSNIGDEVLVQLLYSPDGVTDAILPGEGPEHDDVVLVARIVRNNGGQYQEYAFFGHFNYTGPYVPGYIYGIVHEHPDPDRGHSLYRGPMLATQPGSNGSPNPQAYEFNTDLQNGNTWNDTIASAPGMRVDWRGSAGFLDGQGNPILPNIGERALVQLVYSPDGEADSYLPGGIPAGNDEIIDYGVVRNNGGLWEDYGLFNWIHYDGAYRPGWIYGVVFGSTSPQAGDGYYAGPLQATMETPLSHSIPATYEMNVDFARGDPYNGSVVVPEMHVVLRASAGFIDAQGDPILKPGGSQAVVKLLHSPDAVADQQVNSGVASDNDSVLFATVVQNGGGFREEYGIFGPYLQSEPFQPGYLYGVIHDSATPQPGDRYYAGPLVPTAQNEASSPLQYEMNSNLVDGNTWNRTVASSATSMAVKWYGSFGFIDEHGVPILPAVGDEARVQLLYSPDGVRDPILPGGVPGHNDVVLAENSVRNNGGQDQNWAFFGHYRFDGYFQSGNVYGILYQDMTPHPGDRYYAGPLQAAQAGSIESYNFNTDFVRGNTWNNEVIAQGLALDFDADGLPNDFETMYFGDPTGAEPHVDSDLDGFSNLKEHIAATDPMDAGSYFGIESIGRDTSDIVVILRNTSVNRSYVLEFSGGMPGAGAWTAAGGSTPGTGDRLPIDADATAESSHRYRGNVSIP